MHGLLLDDTGMKSTDLMEGMPKKLCDRWIARWHGITSAITMQLVKGFGDGIQCKYK